MPQWLTILSWAAIGLGLITAASIALDVRRHPQRMKIMNVIWPVTGLYFPVMGWQLYSVMGRPLAVDAPGVPGDKPRWKSVLLSAMHCGGGCVIGDLVGAPIVSVARLTLAGERLYAEYVVEFVLAYAVGIAFQYFPIRAMRRLPPYEALLDAVKADTLSLLAFEAGMFGWMAVTYFLLFPAHHPDASTIVFWFMMQLAMLLGFATTYPANWLLVKWGVKAGM